ncbi:hypothetical protein [Neobacillus niacini]|nr:hypothetical protein [Neobacillus niacini]MCM3689769.1 hypothetical protein [Neobacillus niacini]
MNQISGLLNHNTINVKSSEIDNSELLYYYSGALIVIFQTDNAKKYSIR